MDVTELHSTTREQALPDRKVQHISTKPGTAHKPTCCTPARRPRPSELELASNAAGAARPPGRRHGGTV